MLTISPPSRPTRRQLLKGMAALSATVLASGCNKALTMSASAASPQAAANTNAQSAPTGPVTQALLSVLNTKSGAIGSGFAGLSYEKSAMCEPLFTASNPDLIGLFQLLGPSVLRVGGNSVDHCVWTPEGAGQTSR